MKKKIAIIGGGSAGLFLSAFLDPGKYDISLYEKNNALGRKFLVAGKGGFNLTYHESDSEFIKKYTPQAFMKEAYLFFNEQSFRQFLSDIGIPTFVGSSQRVFPQKGIKPIEVLNAILAVLENKKINIYTHHTLAHWHGTTLTFNNQQSIQADYIVFALGGASWSVTGSDGMWLPLFEYKNIPCQPFEASNCGYHLDWSPKFIQKYEGKPLKNICIHIGSKKQKGELVITQDGLEGNAIYALSPAIRAALHRNAKAIITMDLKPSLTKDEISRRLNESNHLNLSQRLQQSIKLSTTKIQLLKSKVSKSDFLNIDHLSHLIKKLPLEINGLRPIDEAISTVGGIQLKALHTHFELRQVKNCFCIGEMLDYDAPTGGYLLQSCASQAYYLAHYLNQKIE